MEALRAVSVFGHKWTLSFFCDRGAHFELVGDVDVGSAHGLPDLYKLLASLRAVVRWVHGDFRALFHQVFHLEEEEWDGGDGDDNDEDDGGHNVPRGRARTA